jgi:hypothetical protein
MRRWVAVLALAFVGAAPALAGDNYGQQKSAIDAKLASPRRSEVSTTRSRVSRRA